MPVPLDYETPPRKSPTPKWSSARLLAEGGYVIVWWLITICAVTEAIWWWKVLEMVGAVITWLFIRSLRSGEDRLGI